MIVALTSESACNSILKTFWHEPRPYLISESVIPARCSNFEYGLPSGHTMGILIVYRTLVRLFEPKSKFIWETILLVLTCTISYSRA